jgi:hypothetical protein
VPDSNCPQGGRRVPPRLRNAILAALAVLLAALAEWAHDAVAHVNVPARLQVEPPRPADPKVLRVGDEARRVCDLQYLLRGNNVFRAQTRRAPVERLRSGVCRYDAATATQVRDMKWRLGYPAEKVNRVAGKHLFGILLGQHKRPPLFDRRAAERNPHATLRHSYPLAKRGPLIGYPGQGTHSFTAPPHNWQSDRAVDIAIPFGTPILAMRAGIICVSCGFGGFASTTVVRAGKLCDSTFSGRFGGLRFTLTAEHGDQYYYSHLSCFAPGLRPGLGVRAGQLLGWSGSANGVPHLHLACRLCNIVTTVAQR